MSHFIFLKNSSKYAILCIRLGMIQKFIYHTSLNTAHEFSHQGKILYAKCLDIYYGRRNVIKRIFQTTILNEMAFWTSPIKQLKNPILIQSPRSLFLDNKFFLYNKSLVYVFKILLFKRLNSLNRDLKFWIIFIMIICNI